MKKTERLLLTCKLPSHLVCNPQFFISSIDLLSNNMFSTVYPQPVTIYQLGNDDGEGTFGNFLDAVDSYSCMVDQDPTSTDCGNITSTDVVSVSWGGSEAGDSAAYNTRQCYEYVSLPSPLSTHCLLQNKLTHKQIHETRSPRRHNLVLQRRQWRRRRRRRRLHQLRSPIPSMLVTKIYSSSA